jgi:hypothetical protein
LFITDAEPPRSLGAASKTAVVSRATHAVMPIPVNTKPGRNPSESSGLEADNANSAQPEPVTRLPTASIARLPTRSARPPAVRKPTAMMAEKGRNAAPAAAAE